MNLDIPALLHGAQPLSGCEELDFAAESFNGFAVPQPAALDWTARAGRGEVRLNTRLTATLNAECARCLNPFERAWCSEQQYELRPVDWAEAVPELPFSADGMLDLKELARQELVLEVEPILLCREDCPGLCSRCGLPAEQCRCPAPEQAPPTGDPRLQALRDLLAQENDDDSPQT